MTNMIEDQTRTNILELCSESEYGSWEFWLNTDKTDQECEHIVKTLSDLVNEKKIIPVEHKTLVDQTYQEVPLDIARLKNEVKRSMTPYNVDPDNFYWFLATESGRDEYEAWAKEYWTEERIAQEKERWKAFRGSRD